MQSEINVFYAVGKYDAMGFCPFAVELTPDPVNSPLSKSYEVLSQLAGLILEKQGSGEMTGVLLDKENQTQEIKLGGYTLNVSHSYREPLIIQKIKIASSFFADKAAKNFSQ